MDTETKLKDMLQENTGAHPLDSGGAYGRNWERNQGRDFDSEPEATVDFSYGFIDITVNVYHWLKDRVEYTEEAQRRQRAFETFAYCSYQHYENWIANVESYLKKLKHHGVDVMDNDWINTYNGEELLSQVLLFRAVCIDSTSYVILCIHNGCDVRGGYTKPVFFECDPDYMFDFSRATVFCNGPERHVWDTDDTCHFYYDGGAPGPELQEFPIKEIDDVKQDNDTEQSFIERYRQEIQEFNKHVTDHSQHVLYTDSDGNGYCPFCGYKLEPAMFPAG